MKTFRVSHGWAILAAAALALPACNDEALAESGEVSEGAAELAEAPATPGAFGRGARFSRMFTGADKDGDGKVTEAEARAAATLRFAELDEDKDGYLEREEFASMRKGRGRGMGPGGPGGPAMRMDGDNDGRVSSTEFVDGHIERWKIADADGDGVVTVQEAASVATKMRGRFGKRGWGPGSGKMHGRRAAERFAQMDANQDGQVTKAEAEASHKARFAELDTNRDGVIDGQELTARHEARRAERVAERFAALDADGNGSLSRTEVPPFFAARFDNVDTNGDGAVSSDEMLAAGPGRMGRGKKGPHVLRMDADGDGKVTASEFEQKHAGWFEALDSDGDGVITLDEHRAGRRGMRGHGPRR